MIVDEHIVKEIISKLISELNPLRIILFGSRAWGNPTEMSDLDLLIITDYSEETRVKRASRAYKALRDYSNIPIDILVRTNDEYNSLNCVDGSFFFKISKSGLILYERN